MKNCFVFVKIQGCREFIIAQDRIPVLDIDSSQFSINFRERCLEILKVYSGNELIKAYHDV